MITLRRSAEPKTPVVVSELIEGSSLSSSRGSLALYSGTNPGLSSRATVWYSTQRMALPTSQQFVSSAIPRLTEAGLRCADVPAIFDFGVDVSGRPWFMTEEVGLIADDDQSDLPVVDADGFIDALAAAGFDRSRLINAGAGGGGGLGPPRTQAVSIGLFDPANLVNLLCSPAEEGADPSLVRRESRDSDKTPGTQANDTAGTGPEYQVPELDALTLARLDSLPPAPSKRGRRIAAACALSGTAIATLLYIFVLRADPATPKDVLDLRIETTKNGSMQVFWDGNARTWSTWVLTPDRAPVDGSTLTRGTSMLVPKLTASSQGTCVAIAPRSKFEDPGDALSNSFDSFEVACTENAEVSAMRRS